MDRVKLASIASRAAEKHAAVGLIPKVMGVASKAGKWAWNHMDGVAATGAFAFGAKDRIFNGNYGSIPKFGG